VANVIPVSYVRTAVIYYRAKWTELENVSIAMHCSVFRCRDSHTGLLKFTVWSFARSSCWLRTV